MRGDAFSEGAGHVVLGGQLEGQRQIGIAGGVDDLGVIEWVIPVEDRPQRAAHLVLFAGRADERDLR